MLDERTEKKNAGAQIPAGDEGDAGNSGTLPTVGIPRALLYSRYAILWTTFFSQLGVSFVVSGPTNRETAERGAARAMDEMCLSVKIFFGHVDQLIGKCEYIFVPRIVSFGIRRTMCVTFQALPDMTANIFRGTSQHFLSASVNLEGKRSARETEEAAFLSIGTQLGFSTRDAQRAYHRARRAWLNDFASRVKAQEALYKKPGLKVMIASHPYVIEDEYIGRPVRDALSRLGAVCLRADLTDRQKALDRSRRISTTLKWEFSRELVGGLAGNFEHLDGIILLSVYPCALDSMVNEMLIRKARGTGIPILQLMLDGQTGTVGIETRLESFVDILTMKKEAAR